MINRTTRTTLPVAAIIDRLNGMLANYPHGRTPDEQIVNKARREGIADALATLLHDSGNYAGFYYLDTPYTAGETDESRVGYYTHRRLKK